MHLSLKQKIIRQYCLLKDWRYELGIKIIMQEHLEWVPRIIWVNYNDLTTTSLEIMVSKGNHPQMALIQISELL